MFTAEVRVDGEGVIRVWDEAWGHWTACHSIPLCDRRAIRARREESKPLPRHDFDTGKTRV